MGNVLKAMHDNNAKIAKFKIKFNGDIRDTIRFIFAIKEYESITAYQAPNTLFLHIHGNIAAHIQKRFSRHKNDFIKRQIAALPPDATADQLLKAQTTYTTDAMQSFFMTNFRPTITRGQIFGQIKSIRMRYNENPQEVLSRVIEAIDYAKRTIELLNETRAGLPMQLISDEDITQILVFIFGTKNNHPRERNVGLINRLVHKKITDDELIYDNENEYAAYSNAINKLCTKISGLHHAGDSRYKPVHYEPYPLDLWEVPQQKPKPVRPTQQPTKPPTKPKPYTPKRRNPYDRDGTPKPKRPRPTPRPTPRTPTTPTQPRQRKTVCWRCGRDNHKVNDCIAVYDINGEYIGRDGRKEYKDMPFRHGYKAPKQPPRQPTQRQPRQPRPRPHTPYQQRQSRRPHWERYPNPNPNPYNPRGEHPNTNPHTPRRNTPHQPRPNIRPPSYNPRNPNQPPRVNTMIADLASEAEADTHIDPAMLAHIHALQSMINGNTDNRNPRQDYPQS